MLANLVRDIDENHAGHLSTGMLGTNALVNVLPRHGAADVMFLNVKLLGSVQKFFYRDLAGIRATAPGFREWRSSRRSWATWHGRRHRCARYAAKSPCTGAAAPAPSNWISPFPAT